MDELDRHSYKAGPSPLDSRAESVSLKKGTLAHPRGAPAISLDGDWEMAEGGVTEDRTFYFVNYEAVKGSLFKLPRTTVRLRTTPGRATVTNVGKLPAVGVAVLRLGHLDTFTADDNYFWLEPGETHQIQVVTTEGLSVQGWNTD